MTRKIANVKEKRFKNGYTLIEVMLVLAITGLILAGLISNTSSTISKQRYSASVQDFTSLLREVYNQAENVQIADRNSLTTARSNCTIAAGSRGITNSTGTGGVGAASAFATTGRSSCSVYGKLITIGAGNKNELYVYDVLGDVIDSKNTLEGISSDAAAINAVHLGIFSKDTGGNLHTSVYSHTISWNGWLEDINGDRYRAAILIVRSPLSGLIQTYYYNFGTSANYNIYDNRNAESALPGVAKSFTIGPYSNSSDFNICLDSSDRSHRKPRMITIKAGARNVSDIVLVDQDSSTNLCEED